MRPLGIMAVGLALVGCGSRTTAPSLTSAVNKAAQAGSRAADAGVATESVAYVYSYSPMGKRDPFRSPVEDLQQRSESGTAACSEPLCQWELDQLKLVAVVTGDANPIAMVEDPQTRGYIIRRGSKVGKQGGQVTQILRDSLTVTEYFQSPDGKRTPNAVTMRLKEDTQMSPPVDLSTGRSVP
jgi:type IV pilus assembly protein PilP